MPTDRNAVEATVQIQRPVGDVFAFYRDVANLPRFLGDVMSIEPAGRDLFRWTIQGPFGVRFSWIAQMTEVRPNALIRYQTVGLPGFRTQWEILFAPGQTGGTEVREVMTLPLGAPGRAALALIGKDPAEEVRANLNRLKQLLETGKVTDTTYAVAGKFPGAALK
jgi:uncharacterized membrane protein